MSRLTDLIAQAKVKDPVLGADLEAEIRVLQERRPFGLNFERHQPEAVELPGRPVRKGDKVRVLPPRGTTKRGDQRLWRVTRIEAVDGDRTAHVELTGPDGTTETQAVLVDDLVVVAEFRDPIYPGLVSTGKVDRGGPDKPFHTVINAENFHALQTLLYTHRGQVDCIYIDPPYNTGAKDWKYNNDYVDGEDLYRHSKWLAFMERRLLLARELLNPADSVLIVTIDEKEVLRLGLLLQQTFPHAVTFQMVSSQINPAASARRGAFGRSDEYIFFVMLGSSAPARMPLSSEWVSARGRTFKGEIRWDLVMKSGSNAARQDRPGGFYPVYIDPAGPHVHSVGDVLPMPEEPTDRTPEPGLVALWPIRKDGSPGRWRLSPETLWARLGEGLVRVGGTGTGPFTLYYLPPGEVRKIETGQYKVIGRRPDGSPITSSSDTDAFQAVPTTQWRISAHDATQYGSRLLAGLLPGRSFPFPKSLYAVEDTVRFFVAGKPEAVVVDFFSGSGTTAHAVMRLNRQDGGTRRSVSVTNNEVSAEEQSGLRRQGLRPGDEEWEALGICDYITKPRLRAAVTGQNPDGQPVKGDYKFTDKFPMSEGFEENVEFFDLTYESPWRVARNRDFAVIAPLLWLRAGSRGRRIDSVPEQGWDVADTYGVLVNLDAAKDFTRAVSEAGNVDLVFLVTDDDRRFQMVAKALPEAVDVVRLYESYLRNFEINTGRR